MSTILSLEGKPRLGFACTLHAHPFPTPQIQPTAYAAFSPATAPAKQLITSRFESSADIPTYAPAPKVAMPLPATPSKVRALHPPVEYEPKPHQLKLEEAMEMAAARRAGGGAEMSRSGSAGGGSKRSGGSGLGGGGVKRRATEGEVQRLGKLGGLGVAGAKTSSPVRRTKSEGAVAKASVAGGQAATECVTLDSTPVEVVELASEDSVGFVEEELDEYEMPPSGQRCG